ncbi:DNA polymerase I [Patescibacteria group bacterium]|nr:DNA polymerase I [Patescibacteria group bacterium]
MPKKSKRKLVLIDGNALIHRAFHAVPPLTTQKGELVNAAFGFTSVLLKAIKDLNPTHIAVAFDKKAPTFRHKLYKEYKATRKKAPDELYQQIPLVHQIVETFNIPVFELKGYEADDIIGTLSKKVGIDNVIVTGDMDALQLVDDDTSVYTLRKGVQDTVIYNEAGVKERYELTPEQLIDYKGLRGDASDNIPGVPGIGEKSATILLKEFGSLENLYGKLEAADWELGIEGLRGAKGVVQKLKDNKEQAILSKKLGTIVTNVPLDFDLTKCELKDFDRGKMVKLFQELGFKSLLARLPESKPIEQKEQIGLFALGEAKEEASQKTDAKYILVDDQPKLADFARKLASVREFAFDTETTSKNAMEAELLGASFSWQEGEAYFVTTEMMNSPLAKKIRVVLTDGKIKKTAHNAKYDYIVLRNFGIEVAGIDFDTMIASYLLNTGSRRHNLDDLAFAEFGYETMKYEELSGGKNKSVQSLADVDQDKFCFYACEDADFTWRLKKLFAKELAKNKKIASLFHDMEMPLVLVLAQMEMHGIKIDVAVLKKLSQSVSKKVEGLTAKIYEKADTKAFNINSTQQLSKILFAQLKISAEGVKKTTTGYSTAAPELAKIKGKHKIVPLIEQYRELVKLKNTYLDALPKLVNAKTGRVHTSFNQTVTATGRLSSSDPNLQNIPVRTQVGRQIRQAFVAESSLPAGEAGWTLLSVDYSQIDLRVVAHIAQDKNLLAAFAQDQDIHAATAAIIFKKDIGAIDKSERRMAKTVNFGVLYGMGAFGLAQRLDISRAEAKKFIDNYFASFPALQKYIDETIKFAREKGYVETLLGRRRYLPELTGKGPQVAAAERMAINMPVQGTSADIIKVAMIEVAKDLAMTQIGTDLNPASLRDRRINTDTQNEVRMLLQVHDELVFEVKHDKVEEVAQEVKKIMEGAYELDVALKVDLQVGDNWGELRGLEI